MLDCDQVHRVYLDELGDIRQLLLGVALAVLTALPEAQAPEEARHLLARVAQEAVEPLLSQSIIELVTTIITYKFTTLSREEIDTMLGIRLQETRVYQEAKEEGREEGRRQEAASLVLRLVSRRCGEVPKELRSRIATLSTSTLEDLSEAVLDFTDLADLSAWLTNHPKP